MRDWATVDVHRLDDIIRDARAAADAARDSGDDDMAHRMDVFAKRAVDTRKHIEERKGDKDHDRLDRDFRKLADDSHKIQLDIAQARRPEPALQESWGRVVRVVNEINGVDQPRATSGTLGDEERPTDRDRERDRDMDRQSDRDRYDRDRDQATQPDAAQLPADLNRRLNRVDTLAGQQELGEARSQLDRFSERAAKFSSDYATLRPEERQVRARALLDEARQIQQSFTTYSASPQLVDEWNGVIDTLSRIAGR